MIRVHVQSVPPPKEHSSHSPKESSSLIKKFVHSITGRPDREIEAGPEQALAASSLFCCPRSVSEDMLSLSLSLSLSLHNDSGDDEED